MYERVRRAQRGFDGQDEQFEHLGHGQFINFARREVVSPVGGLQEPLYEVFQKVLCDLLSTAFAPRAEGFALVLSQAQPVGVGVYRRRMPLNEHVVAVPLSERRDETH